MSQHWDFCTNAIVLVHDVAPCFLCAITTEPVLLIPKIGYPFLNWFTESFKRHAWACHGRRRHTAQLRTANGLRAVGTPTMKVFIWTPAFFKNGNGGPVTLCGLVAKPLKAVSLGGLQRCVGPGPPVTGAEDMAVAICNIL